MSVSGSEGPGTSGVDPRSEPTRRIATLEDESVGGAVRLTAFGATDVGLVREHNEDNFVFVDLETRKRLDAGGEAIETELGTRGFFAAVCDGMGGAAAGEVASQMGVDILAELLLEGDPPSDRDEFAQRLVDAIQEAGIRIFGAAKMDRTRRGMGTTSTVAGMIDEILFVGQVGDSRAYVLRQGELRLITKDQSLVNQLIEAGQLTEEEAESFEHSNIILQALGTTERVAVDLTFLEMRRGDRLMLCSDGLSGLVHSSAIAETLRTIADPEEAARSLIAQANEGGGHDNITCLIIDFNGPGLQPPSDDALPSYQQYPLAGKDAERAIVTPAREPSVKTVAQKPGADVKRGRATQGENVPSSAPLWKHPFVVFFLALGVVLLLATVSGIFSSDDKSADGAQKHPATDAIRAPVEVAITSELPASELYIDGAKVGNLESGQTLFLELRPGAYRVEARQGDEVLSRSDVLIRPGRDTTIGLRPSAFDDGAYDDLIDEESVDEEQAPQRGTAAPAIAPRDAQGRSDSGSPSREGRERAEPRGDGATDQVKAAPGPAPTSSDTHPEDATDRSGAAKGETRSEKQDEKTSEPKSAPRSEPETSASPGVKQEPEASTPETAPAPSKDRAQGDLAQDSPKPPATPEGGLDAPKPATGSESGLPKASAGVDSSSDSAESENVGAAKGARASDDSLHQDR